jgi:hypothetical protein
MGDHDVGLDLSNDRAKLPIWPLVRLEAPTGYLGGCLKAPKELVRRGEMEIKVVGRSEAREELRDSALGAPDLHSAVAAGIRDVEEASTHP